MIPKGIVFCALAVCLFLSPIASAGKTEDTRGVDSPEDWHISVQPEPSRWEKEAARWTPLLKNDTGTYAYEASSVALDEKNADVAEIVLRVSALKPEILVHLNARYSYVLDEDTISHMEQRLKLNRRDNSFATAGHKYLSRGGIVIEETKIPEEQLRFHSIPEGSVAEAALEIVNEILASRPASKK